MLSEEALFVWEMWNTLHRLRQVGMAANPIEFSEAVAYIEFYCPEYTIQDRHDLLQLFLVIEDSWLAHQREKEISASDGSDTFLPSAVKRK